MKQMIRLFSFFFLVTAGSFSYGQMNQYQYKREIKEISQPWQKIVLPNAIFGKTTQNLNDLRIFGLTKENDTIEAPFLLRTTFGKDAIKKIPFKLLNETHTTSGYYYTFVVSGHTAINQIKLHFGQPNFDWRVKLEGSQDQNKWFTVMENYRILSIKNNQTNFQFTKLTFPRTQYRFFRLFVKSKEKPLFQRAEISEHTIVKGQQRIYTIKKSTISENKKQKSTEITVDLGRPLRVNQLRIAIADSFDYYRPITIKYLADSFKTKKGWIYNYNLLTSGTLNSLEENKFTFNSTTLQKLRIYIDNEYNQPLSIDAIQVSGSIYELIARFTVPADYFLTYGNKDAVKPHYDIERFTNKIPKTVKEVKLGKELTIKQGAKLVAEPLFKNKIWLWGIMVLIIVVLGWFSWKMIRNTQGEK